MDTFGERLRNERESRGLTLEAVAETLAIDPACLQALEGNDFQSLPEEGVMMGCLRAYAECLEVDSGLDGVRREKCGA